MRQLKKLYYYELVKSTINNGKTIHSPSLVIIFVSREIRIYDLVERINSMNLGESWKKLMKNLTV